MFNVCFDKFSLAFGNFHHVVKKSRQSITSSLFQLFNFLSNYILYTTTNEMVHKTGCKRHHRHSKRCSRRRSTRQKRSYRRYRGGDLPHLTPGEFKAMMGGNNALSPATFPSQMGGADPTTTTTTSTSTTPTPDVKSMMSGDGKPAVMPHGADQKGGYFASALVPFGLLGAQKLYQRSRKTQRQFKGFPGNMKRSLKRVF